VRCVWWRWRYSVFTFLVGSSDSCLIMSMSLVRILDFLYLFDTSILDIFFNYWVWSASVA
jgi:hypothetical protein